MEEKIKNFFEGAGKEATEHLGSGACICIKVGRTAYTFKITEEREVKVEKDEKEPSDIEIRGQEKTMSDLFSSSGWDEYYHKMISNIKDGQEPEVKILMERTAGNSAKFHRLYLYFLRRMVLLK